ncbi:ABC-type uncharacterized transport system permease subunit [Rhizobium leguminosarum]|nr:ABC-type uncharacterized transport system permease subunit [Rhizobium leguminosarum]
MEYRGAFWLDRLAQILSYGSVFATIGILLARFQTLGGWSWSELALLYSFQLLAYSLGAAMSFTQLRDLEELVRLGSYDVLLVKPFSPWVYLIFSMPATSSLPCRCSAGRFSPSTSPGRSLQPCSSSPHFSAPRC